MFFTSWLKSIGARKENVMLFFQLRSGKSAAVGFLILFRPTKENWENIGHHIISSHFLNCAWFLWFCLLNFVPTLRQSSPLQGRVSTHPTLPPRQGIDHHKILYQNPLKYQFQSILRCCHKLMEVWQSFHDQHQCHEVSNTTGVVFIIYVGVSLTAVLDGSSSSNLHFRLFPPSLMLLPALVWTAGNTTSFNT